MEQSTFQFKNPILDKLVFEPNHNFNKDEFEGLSINSSTRVDKSEKNKAVVELEIVIGDKEYAPFYLDIVMKSKFIWTDRSEDEVDILLRSNAPALLLSYIRPIIANVTGNSVYPLLNLPFMNFIQNEIDN